MIDPPGIGDTEGFESDTSNFENIMGFIANIPELHAIVILTDGTQQKLTHRFKYCIGQLLMRLHGSALKNLVFCFTRSSSGLNNAGQDDKT